MARDAKEWKRKSRNREYGKLQATFEEMHKKGVYFKRLHQMRGVNLPFYDYYDSYFEEFAKVTAQAKQQYPSLIDVVEVEDAEYFGSDQSQFAPGMQQIFWRTEAEENGYGASGNESNVNGYTNGFHTNEGELKTLVVIRKSIPNSKPHREFKYVLKLVALLHELGHVHDMEHEINFNHSAKTFNVIEAEVYAHLYALERMEKSNYYQCFQMLVDALKRSAERTDYFREVGKLTLEKMPDYKLVDVNSLSLEPFTVADFKALGVEGRKALGLSA